MVESVISTEKNSCNELALAAYLLTLIILRNIIITELQIYMLKK